MNVVKVYSDIGYFSKNFEMILKKEEMRKYDLLQGKEAKFARFGCNFQEKLIRKAFLKASWLNA